MNKRKLRFLSMVLAVIMTLTLLPAAALADDPPPDSNPLDLNLSSDPNKRKALNIDLSPEYPLFINGVRTLLKFNESGKPLVSAGALMAVTNAETLSAVTGLDKSLFHVEDKFLYVGGEQVNPADPDGVAMAISGSLNATPDDSLTDAQKVILDKARNARNSPSMTWEQFVEELLVHYKRMKSEEALGRPSASTVNAFYMSLLVTLNITQAELEAACSSAGQTSPFDWLELLKKNADLLGEGDDTLDAKPLTGVTLLQGQGGAMQLNAMSFMFEVEGGQNFTLEPNVLQANTGSGDTTGTASPASPTALIIIGDYTTGVAVSDTITENEVATDGGVTTDIPSAGGLQKVTVEIHNTDGSVTTVKGLLYSSDANTFAANGVKDSGTGAWTLVWQNGAAGADTNGNTASLDLSSGFAEICIYENPILDESGNVKTIDDDGTLIAPDYRISNNSDQLSEESNVLSSASLAPPAMLALAPAHAPQLSDSSTGTPATTELTTADTTATTDANGAPATTTTDDTTTTTETTETGAPAAE